ncbi:PrsW family intramembrane metalloprotease [Brachybacterium sp. EF45031]|uniref:PrsW family intramembrane metalloprotease n=1 Tax=Brachybacterium sillae TaxID=2810536 RepID=UPI00217ED660|nr:PrsW family intramembrane metalloprotease [Brachybacterium sillae]MCS6712571.1 PrsW family intramembrane metalloprotease [Brachybacterium sillae]
MTHPQFSAPQQAGADPRQQYGAASHPAPQAPSQEQPRSAWAQQTPYVQAVARHPAPTGMPVRSIVQWILAGILGLGFITVLGLGFALFALQGRANPAWWLVYAFLAALSLLVIALLVWIADRWDPEPLPLLLTAVFWGAVVAVAISLVINSAMSSLGYAIGGETGAAVMGAIVSAPITEETSKGLGLLVILLVARRHFSGPLDGLIYGALIGGGFAFVENILYYTRAFTTGLEYGMDIALFSSGVTVVLRGVFGIFGHCMYTSLTGVIVGLAVRHGGTWRGVLVFLVATWPGIALHALWNGTATFLPLMLGGSALSLLLMVVLQMLESALWLGLIGWLVVDEVRHTRRRLSEYAGVGWLTQEEVAMLGTWGGRREGRRWAAAIGAKPLMKRFIADSAELASARQRILAEGATPKAIAVEHELLQRMTANRQALLQRAGQAA